MNMDQAELPSHVIYRQVRENVIGLLTERADAAGRGVPACPGWTVGDLVHHLVGICARVIGRLSGQGQSQGQGQAQAHGPAPEAAPSGESDLAKLLIRWAELGECLDRLSVEVALPRGHILAMDAFTHELDLRSTLKLPPPAGHPGYPGMLAVVIDGLSEEVVGRGLPSLRIELPGAHWIAGRDRRPAATVWAPGPHDLYRTLTGRRTCAQITALSWSADPAPWLPAFAWGPFSPPARPAEEPVGC